MRGSLRVLVIGLAVTFVAAACSSNSSGGGSEAPGQQGGTYSFYNGEPNHLIPQNDYESAGTQAFQALWTRLVDFDPTTYKPVPAQADSITQSSDGLTYDIKIKSGWTFHNGEPVTAQSYVDAWNYAAYGPNAYILNFFFDKIEGYDALNPSSGTPKTKELSGLKVVSDTEFTVKLSNPFSQFEYTLGFDAFDPLPKAFYQDPKAFDEQPIGDGPYMMDGKWQHDQTINLQRYPDYAGTPGFADKIELRIYQGDAAWLDFQAGNLDITLVGSDHLNEARKSYSDTLSEEPGATLLYLNIPLYDPQYQNKEVRQALSLAIDRQAVMNAILVAETPADDFMPPPVTGYRQGACQYCQFNADLAKQKLADAGGFNGTLTLNFYADDTTLEQAMEAVAQQWHDNLGITTKLNAIPQNTYFSGSGPIYTKKMTGPWWDGWTEDYPSIQDFLEPIYGANGGYNTSGYLNKQFDSTLDTANQQSLDESIPTYQQADDMILEDMPAIPWGYLGFNTVHDDNVTNLVKVPGLDELDLAKVQVVGASGASASAS
ncbi:MAG TPA: ABC transporter substrate-binding protein [Actinomycetota bacterium]|jgi:peptide/nickel transport system substrate-binding protein/oligopeptide transport system substrate-binding protein|nr:ABC transporter substrate-binding protein [Actinomycetota bacterium]